MSAVAERLPEAVRYLEWRRLTVSFDDPSQSTRNEAISALFASGAETVEELGDGSVVTYLPGEAALERARNAVATLPGTGAECGGPPGADWSRWRGSLRAWRVGRFLVTPPWLPESSDPRAIVIDPATAFGTGEHASTRGALRMLERAVRKDDFVADLGAGSGVLSIAAAKLGAGRVAGVEIDPFAVANAEANVERNGVGELVRIIEGDAATILPLVAPVRLVVANISAEPIVELLPLIAASIAADGEVILGGVMVEERSRILASLASQGWSVTAEDVEEDWWTVSAARP